MKDVKDQTTQELHLHLKKIATCNNLILKGLFPGVAFLEIKESAEWMEILYNLHFEEFKNREDAPTYEPNIANIGKAVLVDK